MILQKTWDELSPTESVCCLWLMSNLLNTWQLKYSRRDLCLIQIQLGGKVFDLVWNFLWFYNLLKHLKKCIPLLLSLLPPNHSGVGAARSGNLTFMVGGVEEEFAAAQELLGCMGSNVVYCGAVGTGQVTFSHHWHWFDDVKSANVPSFFPDDNLILPYSVQSMDVLFAQVFLN